MKPIQNPACPDDSIRPDEGKLHSNHKQENERLAQISRLNSQAIQIHQTLCDLEQVPLLADQFNTLLVQCREERLFFRQHGCTDENDCEYRLARALMQLPDALLCLAYSLYRISDNARACKVCRKAFSIACAFGLYEEQVRSCLLQGVIYTFACRLRKAEKALKQAKAHLSLYPEEGSLWLEYRIVSLRLALARKNIKQAERIETRALRLLEEPNAHPVCPFKQSDLGELAYARALLAMTRQENTKAEELLKTAIHHLKEDAPVQQVNAFNQLSALMSRTNQKEEAFIYAQKAWTIRQQFYGDEHLLTSISLGSLANCARVLWKAGLPCPWDAETILATLEENTYRRHRLCTGKSRVWYGRSLLDLAQMHLDTNKYTLAKESLAQAEQLFTELEDTYYLIYVLEKQIDLWTALSCQSGTETNQKEVLFAREQLERYQMHFSNLASQPDNAAHPAVRRNQADHIPHRNQE